MIKYTQTYYLGVCLVVVLTLIFLLTIILFYYNNAIEKFSEIESEDYTITSKFKPDIKRKIL